MSITFGGLGRHGQLGNQMFQYALLLGIKYKNNIPIVIDPQTKETSYLFNFFNLQEYELAEFAPVNAYIEKQHSFNSEVFSIDQDTNFIGYFQSEKYFKHCVEVVKKEYTFKEEVLQRVDTFLEPYTGKKLVSVHVRRGDYLVNPTFHPQPLNEYYYNAMDMLDDGNTVFICVSNDRIWCEENLKRDNVIYQFNDLIFDMCLISKCHDHIIANSTFSWWGAWLGNAPNKRVVAPKTWFGPAAEGLDTKDIYCDDFIIL
jgi:hypothetical protein